MQILVTTDSDVYTVKTDAETVSRLQGIKLGRAFSWSRIYGAGERDCVEIKISSDHLTLVELQQKICEAAE